jgi:heme/copper-type cytochrome/quinol oxidase subunit 2
MLDVLDLFINLTNLQPMISPEPKIAQDLIWLIIGSAVMMAVIVLAVALGR